MGKSHFGTGGFWRRTRNGNDGEQAAALLSAGKFLRGDLDGDLEMRS